MANNGASKSDLSRAFFPARREQEHRNPEDLDWKMPSFDGPAASHKPNEPKHVPISIPKKLESKIFNIPKPGAKRPEHHRPAPVAPFKPAPTRIELPGNSIFRPINLANNAVPPTIDLRDSDDEFDAALRDNLFGDADPFQWVDPQKANESMKALLEGAFDEEEVDGGKRRRLPRRAKVKPEPKTAPKTLAERLETINSPEKKPAEPKAEDDEDDGVVEGLKVKLLPHQIEGVGWMIDKETKKKKGGILPRGGILADDMGLGKTIQSLSLILTNPRPTNDELEADKKTKISKDSSRATLVVAPLALIQQWKSEIDSKSEGLTVRIHHGASRTKSAAVLQSNDVVITTYQTLTSEHATAGSDIGPNSGCFGVYWYRIILDEAHTIKNSRAKCTQAAYNLRSVYRWCLTGTPVQNNLDELQSLIRFLQIKPYNDNQMWKQQITAPMKNGRGGLAVRRLQAFLRACMKRRTKDVLRKDGALGEGENSGGFQLMERNVQTIAAEFDHQERKFYDNLESRLQDNLVELLMGGKQDYIGALVLLLRLRQACNHPHLLRGKMEKDRDALATGLTEKAAQKPDEAEKEVDDLANMMGGLSVQIKKCDLCKTKLTATEAGDQLRCNACEKDLSIVGESAKPPKKTKKETIKEKLKRRAAKNRRAILDSDDEQDEDTSIDAGTEEDAGTEDAGTEEDEYEDSDDSDESGSPTAKAHPNARATSTKINHLLDILEKETPEHKVIVFSQFTTMLDIIEPFLVSEGHRFVRYDGSMRNDEREASLNKLRTDPRTKVLLCSLKCGSLGLNLTAASRVVLVEPFWNPFVEEQAIDRVHRLNQTKDVTVYRLTIADSVEERILRLQDAKRALANAALEGGKAVAKLSMQDIMALFRHDAEHQWAPDKDPIDQRGGLLKERR